MNDSTSDNLKKFIACRDKTRSIGDSIDRSKPNDYEATLKSVKEEYNTCYQLGDSVKKDYQGTDLEGYINEAVDATKVRIISDNKVIETLMKIKSEGTDAEFQAAQKELQGLNFAIGFVKQREAVAWQEYNINKASPHGKTFFHVSIVIVIILILARFASNKNNTEKKKESPNPGK